MESIATNFSSFYENLATKVARTVRIEGSISSEDVNFHRSSSAEFSESLDEQSERLLALSSSLIKVAAEAEPGDKRRKKGVPDLKNIEDVEYHWSRIVDVIDNLLEKADTCLDEFTGIIKKLDPAQQAQAREAASRREPRNFPTIYDYGPSKIPKPQLQFERVPDARDVSPFRPLLKSKPHAIVPLEQSLQMVQSDSQPAYYPNPYEAEIRAAGYPSSVYATAPPVPPQPFESTKAVWVDTLEGVSEMLAELRKAKEIAVDLEHHDVHSYHGLVSLMQISTRDKDWVIDTLQPWREELQQLNEVFADPSILKVFHGSSMDIIWLQRDLGLYIVGLFDTYHAAAALEYPKRSLKYLLAKFANFQADKQYQMADWRLRPLTEEMFNYARADTHFLLHVYDHLRNQLLEKSQNLIDYVLEHSKAEALQRYERPVYDAETGQGSGGWYDLLARSPVAFSREQFAVFRAVHQWRDEVARAEDEGVQCVFPKHFLFKLAMTMPLDKHTLFKTLSPMTPIARSRADSLLAVIKAAKIAGANGPELHEVIKPPKRFEAVAAPPTVPTTPDVEETGIEQPRVVASALRADSSQFWGGALEQESASFVPPSTALAATQEAIRLSLPIPPMPSTIVEVREKLAPAPAATATPAESTPPSPPANPVFTVKEVAARRKRKAPVEAPPASSSSTSSSASSASSSDADDDDEEAADSSVESSVKEQSPKKTRTEAKRPSQGEKKNKNTQDTTPFDYNSAPSVLHAPKPAAESTAASSTRKPFNPYGKSLEAPSGVRKPRAETAGRSYTFRR